MGKAKLPVTVVLGLSLVALVLLSSVVQDAAAMQGSLNYHTMAADQENGICLIKRSDQGNHQYIMLLTILSNTAGVCCSV